jgi:hypothetical protein
MMKKSKGGAPTKYSAAMLAKAKDYVANYSDYGDVVPTIIGLAYFLEVATNTVYNWANEDKPEFLSVFTRVEQLQHNKLISGGLLGDYNPAITKMMLTKHGYSDKTVSEVSGPNGGPVQNAVTFNFTGVNADSD